MLSVNVATTCMRNLDRTIELLYAEAVEALFKTRHEKTCLCHVRNTKAPINLRIRVVVVRCLDSMKPLVFIYEISSLYLAYVAAQAGLCLTWCKSRRQVFS